MGTDIHMRGEFRRSADEPWEAIGRVFPYRYFDPLSTSKYYSKPLSYSPFGDRNYRLFTVLAGVRNGYGFAGVPTHTPIEPLSEPRGLPEDIALHESEDEDSAARRDGESALDFAERGWIFGDHSFSFATLRELLDYDWDQPLHQEGIVESAEMERCEDEGRDPNTWCGGVSGPRVEIVEIDEFRRRRATDTLHPQLHVRHQWTTSLRDAIGHPWFSLLESMRRWGTDWQDYGDHRCAHNPDYIRLVFGFDS